MFLMIFSLTFYKTIFSRTGREVISYREFVRDFQILHDWLIDWAKQVFYNCPFHVWKIAIVARRVSQVCLSKALFAYGRMLVYPQTTLSLCFVLSLVNCFPFVVTDLRCVVSQFSYAMLSMLKKFKMYCRGGMVVESPTKPYCDFCKSKLSLQLTIFNFFFKDVINVFLYLSRFIQPISLKRWSEATSYHEFIRNFQISQGCLVHQFRTSVAQSPVPYLKSCILWQVVLKLS